MSYAPQITLHFALSELACHDEPSGQTMPGDVYHELTDLCQHVLEPLRAIFGPLTILSGYRDPAHNAAVGGASSSRHLLGQAADIQADDAKQIQIAAAASKLDKVGGIGLYPGRSLVHIDIRPRLTGGFITTWMQADGSYRPLSTALHAALKAAGAEHIG